MINPILSFLALAFTSSNAFSSEKISQHDEGNAQISYEKFLEAAVKVQGYRAKRRVDLKTFLKYSKEPNTIILDTRSKKAYDNIHIKGAVHLNFSDFTKESLAKTIPSKNTRILIYCNNNFFGEQAKPDLQAKRLSVALNVPTFINLFEYGYKNVYELKSIVPVDPKVVPFAGKRASSLKSMSAGLQTLSLNYTPPK